jgi:hypothetical protein
MCGGVTSMGVTASQIAAWGSTMQNNTVGSCPWEVLRCWLFLRHVQTCENVLLVFFLTAQQCEAALTVTSRYSRAIKLMSDSLNRPQDLFFWCWQEHQKALGWKSSVSYFFFFVLFFMLFFLCFGDFGDFVWDALLDNEVPGETLNIGGVTETDPKPCTKPSRDLETNKRMINQGQRAVPEEMSLFSNGHHACWASPQH